MKTLSEQAYQTMRTSAQVIEADDYGEKVLLLPDGTYLKLFRVKRLISSARLLPYSKRFVRNAEKLKKLGIPTVTVIESFKIPSIKRTAVHYQPLEGTTLRSLPGGLDEAQACQLGAFIRELHDKGVYFRSLHLGNVVLTPENKLGLIDIADMELYNRPLPETLQLRNFQHLCRYDTDRSAISKQFEAFTRGLDTPTLIKKIRPLFDRLLTTEPSNLQQPAPSEELIEATPKETIVQVRQTTAGLMESTNQFLQAFDSNRYHKVVIFLKGTLSEGKTKRVAADEVIFMTLSDAALTSLKLGAVCKLVKLLNRYKPTVLFAHRFHSIWLAGVASLFVPIRSCFAVLHGNNQLNRWGRRLFTQVVLKNRFYFVGISNVVRQDLLTSNAGLLPGRVFATPNSLDIDNQLKYLHEREQAQETLKIPKNKYIIGNVARLSPTKNQKFLITSFAEALTICPDIVLVIVGDGKLEQQLKALTEKLGVSNSVLFTGRIDRAADYMKAFDLFAITSNNEGFGRVLIEAMVARIPIIATDIPAFVEVLSGSGTLVRPDDTKALAEQMTRHANLNQQDIDNILADQDFVLYDRFCLERFKARFQQLYNVIRHDENPST